MAKRKGTIDLKNWATMLLWERVPLTADAEIEKKCDALAAEFVGEHLDKGLTIDNVLELMLPWVRARGYMVFDKPRSPYATYDKDRVSPIWGPGSTLAAG